METSRLKLSIFAAAFAGIASFGPAAEAPVARPGAKMGTISIKGHYEHPMSRWNIALRISDPWHPGDFFLYRLPEGFQVNGRTYLAQKDGVDEWPGVQPDGTPEWRIDPSEHATGYAIHFYDGIDLAVEAWAGPTEVTFRYIIRNRTAAPIQPDTGSCLMLWTAPSFVDRRHARTFIWAKKKPVALRDLPPTPAEMKRWPFAVIGVGRIEEFAETKVRWVRREAAEHGLICVDSQDGTKAIGLAWEPAETIFARSTIPCVHSEPKLPAVPPGKAVQVTGRLYFSERGIADIERRFHDDRASAVLHAKVID